MTGLIVDLDEVVDRIREQGVWAYVEQTGGGCATIFAGAWHTAPDGNHDRTVYAAVAGPGEYGWGQRPSTGHTDDFLIGADDQGKSDAIDCSTLAITSTRDLAELIVTQTRLPLGKALTHRQARSILRRRRQAERKPSKKPMPDGQALDIIAEFMNQPGPWNGGDVCEVVADALMATGRKIDGL